MRSALVPFLAMWILASATAGADALNVVLYPGYGYQGDFVIEGRVLEEEGTLREDADSGVFGNLWNNLGRFLAEEREGLRVRIAAGGGRWLARTDEDGFFSLASHLPGEAATGWLVVSAHARKASGEGRLLMVPAANTLGIISDIDDTVMVSEVGDTASLLANTLLKNPHQRRAVPGMADLYRRTLAANSRPEAAPLFYLSASPRQLHGYLSSFLDTNGFPPGVLLTKKIGIETAGDPLLDQRAYKIRRIEEVLTRLPRVRFILVGDDGEQDPEVYREIRARHPEQVADIWIRRLSATRSRPLLPGQKDIATLLTD